MTESNLTLQQQVQAAMDAQGLSKVQTSKHLGVSDATLGEWLRGNYKGNNANVESKAQNWLLSLDKQQAVAPQAAFVETPTAKSIVSVLEFAQYAADIGVVYGGAGVGKTTAAKRYKAINNNVTHVVMYPAVASQGYCLEEIAENLGISGIAGAPKLHRAIVARLTGKTALLIIDEAQHLKQEALEAVRSIHDAAECGLVLMGNESVYSRLTGGSRSAGFAQLFSRLGKRKRLNKPSDKDVIAVARSFGVEGSGEISLLKDIANKHGALRGMIKTMRLAQMYGGMSEQNILTAWNDLGGVVEAVGV